MQTLALEPARAGILNKVARLIAFEQQELYRELYRDIFSRPASQASLLGVSEHIDYRVIAEGIEANRPDVILVGARNLDGKILEALQQVRKEHPKVGTAFVTATYNPEEIRGARRLSSQGRAGMALFLKQSISAVEEFNRIIASVSQGQVILDPTLANILFEERPEYPFLRQLTAREMEILGLLSKGYTNAAIAGLIYTDVKTVENHINTLYSKLRAEEPLEERNPRVVATRMYLSAMENATRAQALAP